MTARLRVRRNVLYRGVVCDIISGRDTQGRRVNIASERPATTAHIVARIKQGLSITADDFRCSPTP